MSPIRTESRAAFAALLPLLVIAVAPAPRAQDKTQPSLQAGANEVLLDIVVRDKKGRDVKDLGQSQFSVTDNGDPVTIKSFHLVDRSSASAAGEDAAKLDPARQIRLVTLVFESLDQQARTLARQAALDLIKGNPEQNVYYSVFVINQRLNALQEFTNDRALLKKAIEMATSGGYTELGAKSDNIKHALEQQIGARPGENGQSLVQQVNSIPAQQGGHDPSQLLMARIMLQMLQFDNTMASAQPSRASIFGLMNLVKDQFELPGRKALLYFSEGLFVPESLQDNFNSIISAANRANVSVYSIDARGLQTQAQNTGATDLLRNAAASSNSQAEGGAVRRDQVEVFDTAQNSLRANTQNSLVALSEGTGGFLVANSNDLRGPLRKIDEDLNTYYEITYAPDIKNYDGSFRKIAVKVARSDVRIQSRSGYFALPPNAGPDTRSYEMPMLAALNQNPPPRDFPFHAAALRFEPTAAGDRCAMVVEVPLKDLTFTEDKAKQQYRAHFAVLLMLKDAKGEVVRKYSRDIPTQGSLDKLAMVKQIGRFIDTEHFDLPPGRYTLNAAVFDREGNKISARKSVFILPPKQPGVMVSSLSLVRQFETQAQVEDPGDPFHFQGGKITPTLTGGIPAGKNAKLSLYFVVYPDASIPDKPSLRLEFSKDGQPLGGANPELPAADKDGRIPYIAESALSTLAPGIYEVQAIVTQGKTAHAERTTFTIEPQS